MADLRRDVLAVPRLPHHPLLDGAFRAARHQVRARAGVRLFRGDRARALFAGLAAHSIMPLEKPASAAIASALGAAGHAVGWPIPAAGRNALRTRCWILPLDGGEIEAATRIDSLPDAPLVLCDISPRQLVAIAGDRLPERYRGAFPATAMVRASSRWISLSMGHPWRAKECLAQPPCMWARLR